MKKPLIVLLTLIFTIVFLWVNSLQCLAQNASEQTVPLYAVIQNKLFIVTESIMPIGVLPCTVNQRAFGVLPGSKSTEFIYWDSVKQKLFIVDKNLDVIKEFPMPGSSVWVHADVVLGVSRNWENGFTYSLYQIKNKYNLFGLASWKIDLFISDCLITSSGVLLAGGSKDDRFNYVYWCVPGQKPQLLLQVSKEKSFLKIIVAGAGAYIYESAQTKAKHRLDIYYVPYEKNNYKPAITLSLNSASLPVCWYGSGFYFDNSLYIPAYDGKETILATIQAKDTVAAIQKTYNNVYGVYVPVGLYKNYYWFISYDYYVDPARWSISYFNIETKQIVHTVFKF
ncbi:MAG TPA: hypothetical protein P5519_02105 [Spirochaetia bacterium]|nr:hypothetical protein [Spirochaetales bacterium]HPD79630.1 hypothetical protein [Spirochaetales bacterium]HQK33804.1 hypothetical protein [Spirochaetales bacterium]HRS64668.1 hypothetical protein [Spirochaetia bacterium]HRV27379.1 hypothetical protein [Spirochaetia bacterium]